MPVMSFSKACLKFSILPLIAAAFVFLLSSGRAADTIRPKVLVIATYELGKDRGDGPGELQFWVERQNLDQSIKVPGLDHPLLTNGKGLYAMVSGTTSRSAIAMMTLAMDPRFDLTHTYFLLGGIAGADPAHMSIGSAAWIQWAVDGDPGYEIDNRETPAAWPYGIIALGATQPGQPPPHIDSTPAAGVSEDSSGGVGRVAYQINPSLVAWAYGLTKAVPLADNPDLTAWRAKFPSPQAQHPPEVIEGASLGTDKFWHGPIMNKWGEDWVRMYTRDAAPMVMSDCEDQGVCLALHQLDRLHKIDFQRFLILRTASNYTVPAPGITPDKSLFDNLANSPGYIPSLEADYRVGSVVTTELLKNWDKYRDQIP
jgi:purine nucleoside permease